MRRFTLARIVLIAIVFVESFSAVCVAQGADKRPFTFADMMTLKRIGGPQISPDGKWVAFTAVDVDLAENKKVPHLWLTPLAGGEARQLTAGTAGEDRGRFSPDGKQLLFVSAQDGSSQIWVTDFDSSTGALVGPPKRVTNISTEADGALWFPDGKKILFTSEVYADCPDDACNQAREAERTSSKVKAMIFDRLFFRHWSSFTRFKRSHLFVASIEGGAAKDITPGDRDVPPFNLGGQDLYAISPDGGEVAYTSNVDPVEAISTNNEIFVMPAAGGTPKKLSTSPGSDSTPLYSPNGRYLAWRMQERAGYESDRFQLVIYDRKSGSLRNATHDFDRWVGAVAWSPDSASIYFTAEEKGGAPIWKIDVGEAMGEPRKKSGGRVQIASGYNDEVTVSPDGRTVVFTRMSAQAPAEIYKLTEGSTQAAKLSHLNDAVLSQADLQPVESFWFAGAVDTQVQGFLMKPPAFDAKKKYPVKFIIHGGPQGAWGDEWSYRWNSQLLAADGYVVVMVNPRGSTGYGQAFIDGINGDWGGKPFEDLMKGLDYVEKTYAFVDKSRECALGASYGGYMINWILGHTNRFKCLVSHDGMFNAESSYGSTEELWFNEWEFKGLPWENREAYRKWSPHEYAAQFKTPTLVVHGQLDYRLDVSEGFQLFTTLQRLKIPSRMLYFPDEGHWVLKPQNSRLWYKTVNQWVDSYLKK
ncbi:MAG TPA: S9 family peptidase [Candidatus Angelobacter sp.]|nr:S9 family peptidase [Candidatus Angelobacter sp.]